MDQVCKKLIQNDVLLSYQEKWLIELKYLSLINVRKPGMQVKQLHKGSL